MKSIMKRKYFNGYFILILVYTLIGLEPVAETGGACNGGLAYVVLGPIILGIAAIQYFYSRKIIGKQKNDISNAVCNLCFFNWVFNWIY